MLMSGSLLAAYTQTIQRLLRPRDRRRSTSPTGRSPPGAISPCRARCGCRISGAAGSGLAVAGGPSISGRATAPRCVLTRPGRIAGQYYIYSAPTAEAKAERLAGQLCPLAAVLTIALPWWAGQALFGRSPGPQPCHPWAYSLAGLGIAVVQRLQRAVEGTGAWAEIDSRCCSASSGPADRAGMIDSFQLAMVRLC